jgi:NAD(P)H-dependent FMN reductase
MFGEKTNHRRMLGIVGSPRRGGNTETLVDEVLRGAEEAGALVEKVILSELDIAPCRACDTCRRTGRCVQQDDMPTVMEQMMRSRVWVLGTPVYWWGPSAQFKAFLDRWYVGGNVISRREGQRVILVIPLGDTDAGTARHVVGMFEDVLAYLKMELFANVLAPGVLRRGEVREHPSVLAVAYRAGQEAVEVKRSSGWLQAE